jgi:cytochrome c
MFLRRFLALFAVASVGAAAPLALAAVPVDEDAAVALAKKGNCYKCHAIDKRKKAPSYKEIAQKYKGKANAEREIYLHMTGNPVVKLEDGEEKHTAPETKDEKELMNLVRWVLSR